jgi:hypothetical protein
MPGVVGRGGGAYAGRGPPAPDRGVPGVAERAPAGVVGFGGVAGGGCTIRGCDTTGRFAGVNGLAGCVGLPGSSMRNRIVGGTTRGGAGGGSGGGGSTTGGRGCATGAAATGAAATGAGSTTTGGGAGSITGGGSGGGGATISGGAGGACV